MVIGMVEGKHIQIMLDKLRGRTEHWHPSRTESELNFLGMLELDIIYSLS
jgi:hypothetical protein